MLALAPLTRGAEAPATPWGDHGHRMIGLVAAEALPDEMPDFFRSAADQLSYLNPEPDRWRDRRERALDRAMDAAHAPEHFIDLELVLGGALAAPNRFAYADSLRLHGVDADEAGLLSWKILEMTQRLRQGFREWRAASGIVERAWIEQRIINDAGILGHYVADGSNPHHTTIHYNGWVGENPHGFTTDNTFHARFEERFVAARVGVDDLRRAAVTPPRIHERLRPAIWDYIDETNSHLMRLYELERREPFGPATASAEHREFTVERLAAGVEMLRDLWFTAWVTSAPGWRPGS